MKYYLIFGRNRHIFKSYYTIAKNMSEAKQNFYINGGDKIINVYNITKKQYCNDNEICMYELDKLYLLKP